MYVYADEPVCNKKTFGETRYILKSSRPILDLEGLKQDYGSFKGWMTLNLRKSGKDATDEVDRLNFEIYDPKHPPKIPKSAWANDDRNKRWLDLLPPEAPPASAANGSLLDSIKVYKEIVADVKEEMQPIDEPSDRTRDTLETMKLAKELFAPTAVPLVAALPPADPFDTAKKIMDMRSNDPITALLLSRMDAQDKAIESARARESELQMKLLEARTSAPQAKGLVDQLVELAALGEKLKPLKEMFGFGGAAEAVTTRAVKSTAYDMVKDIASSPFGQQVGAGIGMLLGSLAQRGAQANGQQVQQPLQAPPIILNAQQPNGTAQPENAEQRMARIGQQIGYGMVYEYFLKDLSGEEFAEAMFTEPEDIRFMQRLGAEDIVRRCRMVPAVWNVVAPKEPAFIEFIQEFCAWNQQAEEAEPPQGAKQTDSNGVEMEDELS